MFSPDLPPLVSPSTGSTLAFVVVVLSVAALFVAGVRRAYEGGGSGRATALAAVGVAAVMGITATLAESGFVAGLAYGPGMMLYLATWNGLALAVALSPVGRRMAHGIPLAALVGFQAFRLPLELVLHRWYAEGVIPIQMTYSGHNFDIVTGVLAAVIGLVLWRSGPERAWRRPLGWIFALIGTGLLVAVVRIAVLSSPVPFNGYPDGPLLVLVFHAPYTWILPICVAGALGGHVVLFRRLLGTRSQPAQASDSAGSPHHADPAHHVPTELHVEPGER